MRRNFKTLISLLVVILCALQISAPASSTVRAQAGPASPPISDQPQTQDIGASMAQSQPGYVAPPLSKQSYTVENLPTASSARLDATCGTVLQNPSLDYGIDWPVIEPQAALDPLIYTSPPNSVRMTDGDDLSRYPFFDTSDSFGQAFFMPADTSGALIQFQVGYFGGNLFDRVYYAFHRIDPYGRLIYPAVGVGLAPLNFDGIWTPVSDVVVNPAIIAPLRGQPVALVISYLGDGFFFNSNAWIDDVQVTVCSGSTQPSPNPGPSPNPNGVDSGFRPNPDGYSFANDGAVAASDYTIADMRRMFGDQAICQSTANGCVPKASAQEWLAYLLKQPTDGHCYGMAITSQRFFSGADNPANIQAGAGTTNSLDKQYAWRNITYYFLSQFFDPVQTEIQNQFLKSPATETLNSIRRILAQTPTQLPDVNIYHPGRGGHAITPYAVEDTGSGIWHVRVYDNNWPNDASRYITVNTNSNTWSYQFSPKEVWNGGGQPGTFIVVPLNLHSGPFIFPSSPPPSTNALAASPSTQIWQSANVNLLVSDGLGGEIGYKGGSFVNTFPGASVTRPIGGLGVEEPPVYNMPAGQHTISIDGASVTAATSLNIAQFGPGYAVALQDLTVAPGARDQITVAADGSGVALNSDAARSLNLSLSNDGSGERFTLSGLDMTSGDTLSASLSSNTLTLVQGAAGTGTYSIDLTRAGAAGISRFIYNNLTINAAETQYIDSTNWATTGQLQLRIDQNSDGQIDTTVDLINQIQYVFLPSVTMLHSGNLASHR